MSAAIGSIDARIAGRFGAAVSFREPRIGREANVVPLTLATPTGTGTAQITLARRAGTTAVTELWTNDARGLEQRFVVHARPDGVGPVEVQQTLTTSLVPRLDRSAQALILADDSGDRLRFGQPAAWDADGRKLPMHLTLDGRSLGLVVDDAGARYPVTIDPTCTQQVYVKASNTDFVDLFGQSVAISGNTMVVGAWEEDSAATGVNGNQADNSADGAGAAYVFVRTGTTWTQQAYLKASNTEASDFFGYSVAISGDTVVVGAIGERSAATGVNGNQADNSVPHAGAVYVFVRNGTTWMQQAYLKASNTNSDGPFGEGQQFGRAVAIAGDTVVVGAPWETSAATGVNGDQSDRSAPDAGAAYVFARNGSTWTQQAYLKASNTDAEDQFGHSVAVAGDTVVVGAFVEASAATGVDGNQADNSLGAAGAAYVFARIGTSWTQQAYLKASNTQEAEFGLSVAIAGDTIVVGAPWEASAATGVNGNQTDRSARGAGAAYVFVRNGTTWTQQAYLKASYSAGVAMVVEFGAQVAIADDTIVVGAPWEASAARAVNGNQTDRSADSAGAAYVFARRGSTWAQQAYLKPSNMDGFDNFGLAVSVSGRTVVVGAPYESSAATGVNGNHADNSSPEAGAAYVFEAAVNGDFDVDDYPDLLFQHTGGELYWWKMARPSGGLGPGMASGKFLPSTNLTVAATGDLVGDGEPDLVLRSPSDSTLEIWRLEGQAITGAWTTQVNSNWRPAAIADVDGDGHNDLIWQGTDGRVVVWRMTISTTGAPALIGSAFVVDSGALVNSQQPLVLSAAQRIAAVVKDPAAAGVDLLVQDTTTGDLINLFVQPDLQAPAQRTGLPTRISPAWQLRATADYNGDGQPDLLFENATTGDLYVWYVVANQIVSGSYLNPSRVDPRWKVVGPR